MKRFERNKRYDSAFDNISNLRWYPYVGPNFDQCHKKVMVYAHNIPVPPEKYEKLRQQSVARDFWTSQKSLEEYTYTYGEAWAKTFRTFIKGAVGLIEDFDEHSSSDIIARVDSFVNRIAYINYIQDLVISKDNNMAEATDSQIAISKEINLEILELLGVTHCICWGERVFRYLHETDGVDVLSEQKCEPDCRGFSLATITLKNRAIKLLKVYHPSMPSWFDPFSENTHQIISSFIES